MDITNFPRDIFLIVVFHLSATDLILFRRVSRTWYKALTDLELNRQFLCQYYPRAREILPITNDVDRKIHAPSRCWPDIFAEVAARYHALKKGRPRRRQTYTIAKSSDKESWAAYYPVAQWHRWLHFVAHGALRDTAKFEYPETLWTYEDGLLVLPSAEKKCYILHDLATRNQVHFHVKHVVRRIRLKDRVLVIEWCEPDAYHKLNPMEEVHRHFASSYDLVLDTQTDQWHINFRNEWKIHFLGMPLNSEDRFFSVHSRTHYAIYTWQPNRGAWGDDDPIESLAVWDVSSPSDYHPSDDPTGKARPEDTSGPNVVRRFSFSDLDFYEIRQRSIPRFRELRMDESHVYIIEEDHNWMAGQHAGHTPPRKHDVKSTGIPFFAGPHWQDECDMENGHKRDPYSEMTPVLRHPRYAPCWRHDDYPWLAISEVFDTSGIRYVGRQCFTSERIFINVKPAADGYPGPGPDISLKNVLSDELLTKGKLCGDERWLIGENAKEQVVVLHFCK